jgi:general transcription factor 3C polypeptide 3 (transcription factor C subunit 4)
VCRKMLGDLEGAAEVYAQGEIILSPLLLKSNLPLVIDADQTNNDAKMKLAELYEIMDEPRKALGLVYQG